MGGYVDFNIGGSCFPQVIHTCVYLVDNYYIYLQPYISFQAMN